MSSNNATEPNTLERFLTGDLDAVPSLETLRSRRLDAWAYTVLPQHHPLKPHLRNAFLQARARHELIKQEVLELVRAWNAAGIVPVLYKGFALAEFVYDRPGVRFHGDVDVLVRPEEFKKALEVGTELGYRDPSVHLGWPFQNPHELPLRKHKAHAAFDVHQRLIHASLPWIADERRKTDQAWQHSAVLDWHGSKVRLLCPADNLLFGLVLARCWSSDDWHLKPHDFLDACVLIHRHRLHLEEVHSRAKALNVSRTFGLFLERCNPWERKVLMASPSNQEKRHWDRLISQEHLPQKWADVIGRGLRVAPMVWRMLAVSGLLIEVVWRIWSTSKLEQQLQFLEKPVRKSNRPPGHVLGSLWWTVRLLRLTSKRIWPVAAYAATQRQGLRTQFKLGERGGAQRAWVELDGEPLPGFDLVIPNWREYKVVFEHPAQVR